VHWDRNSSKPMQINQMKSSQNCNSFTDFDCVPYRFHVSQQSVHHYCVLYKHNGNVTPYDSAVSDSAHHVRKTEERYTYCYITARELYFIPEITTLSPCTFRSQMYNAQRNRRLFSLIPFLPDRGQEDIKWQMAEAVVLSLWASIEQFLTS